MAGSLCYRLGETGPCGVRNRFSGSVDFARVYEDSTNAAGCELPTTSVPQYLK